MRAGANYDWSPFPQEIGSKLASAAVAKHRGVLLSVGLSTRSAKKLQVLIFEPCAGYATVAVE